MYPEHDYDDPDAIDARMNCQQYSTVETPYLVACCKDYDDVTNSFELHSYDDTINLQNVRELACTIIICINCRLLGLHRVLASQTNTTICW